MRKKEEKNAIVPRELTRGNLHLSAIGRWFLRFEKRREPSLTHRIFSNVSLPRTRCVDHSEGGFNSSLSRTDERFASFRSEASKRGVIDDTKTNLSEWNGLKTFCFFFFYVSFPFNTVRPCTLKRRNERTIAGETRPIVKNIRNSIAVDITFRNASLPSTAIRKWIDQREGKPRWRSIRRESQAKKWL